MNGNDVVQVKYRAIMKIRQQIIMKKILLLASCIFLISIGVIVPLFGQISTGNLTDFNLPRDEKFQATDGLVVPWRSGGCKHSNPEFRDKDCYVVTADKYMVSDTVTLYDIAGKVWYRFNLTPEREDYFLRDTKKGFLPFSTYPHGAPRAVVLRLIKESKSWYEVEVNEGTQETKYVLKSDPMWAKDTWKEWLFDGFNLKLDLSKSALYDRPDGSVLFDGADLGSDRVGLLKVEGEWAFIRTSGQLGGPPAKEGWVRWRSGRQLLVGCIFNDFVVPAEHDSP